MALQTEIIVSTLEMHGSAVRLGFEADRDIRIHRAEVLEREEPQK